MPLTFDGGGCGGIGNGNGTGIGGTSIGADSFSGTGGGGGLNCIRRRMICCRRNNLRVGFAGLCTRGLMIAPKIVHFVPRRSIALMSVTTLLSVVVVFALLYPRFNVRAPAAGSDDDDAHDVGVAALIDGESAALRSAVTSVWT